MAALFDSHAHVNDAAFNDDRAAVIARCKDSGMLVTNVGDDYPTSAGAVDLAVANDFCWATVGLHPIQIFDETYDAQRYQGLIDTSQGRVRAVGECGLDYWHIKHPEIPFEELKQRQRVVFEQQIDLALANDLAVMIHGRNGKTDETAYQTIYEIIRRKGVSRATVHCFGGTLAEARAFVAQGLYIGITGIVTFDKTGRLQEIVKELPLESLLIETDAPYLTPVPHRGERNEPVYVLFVAEAIASIKGISLDTVIEQTTENARRLFKI